MLQSDDTINSRGPSIRETLVVAAVSIFATAILFYIKFPPRLPYADEFEYLGYAFGIFEFGVFGQVKNPSLAPTADMFFPPLYPYFLSVIMHVDQSFADATRCVLANMKTTGDLTTIGCAPQYGLAIPIQIFVAGLGVFFVWGTAYRLSGSRVVAILSLLIALASKTAPLYANHFLTEALYLPLAALFGWLLVIAWQEKSPFSASLCGVVLGLLILTRAGWSYTLLAVGPIILLICFYVIRQWGLRRGVLPGIAFVVALGVMLAPWIVRNYTTFDTLSLTRTYGSKSLTHRLPYNAMTTRENLVAFVYWLPDFGDNLAKFLFKSEDYQRLDFGAPGNFYGSGRGQYWLAFHEKLAAKDIAMNSDNQFEVIVKYGILGDLSKHIQTTLALAWRGMFVAKGWGAVTWLFFGPLLIIAVYKKWGAFVVLATPPMFMLGLNAFVSVSIPRYNVPLVPILSFSAAYVLVLAWGHFRLWFHRRKISG